MTPSPNFSVISYAISYVTVVDFDPFHDFLAIVCFVVCQQVEALDLVVLVLLHQLANAHQLHLALLVQV